MIDTDDQEQEGSKKFKKKQETTLTINLTKLSAPRGV